MGHELEGRSHIERLFDENYRTCVSLRWWHWMHKKSWRLSFLIATCTSYAHQITSLAAQDPFSTTCRYPWDELSLVCGWSNWRARISDGLASHPGVFGKIRINSSSSRENFPEKISGFLAFEVVLEFDFFWVKIFRCSCSKFHKRSRAVEWLLTKLDRFI